MICLLLEISVLTGMAKRALDKSADICCHRTRNQLKRILNFVAKELMRGDDFVLWMDNKIRTNENDTEEHPYLFLFYLA